MVTKRHKHKCKNTKINTYQGGMLSNPNVDQTCDAVVVSYVSVC